MEVDATPSVRPSQFIDHPSSHKRHRVEEQLEAKLVPATAGLLGPHGDVADENEHERQESKRRREEVRWFVSRG